MEKIDTTFIDKFKLNELTIKNVGNWIISLRPQQPTIGSIILTLNRKCETLSEITEDESRQLSTVFSEIEKIYKSTFKPDKINYLALMMFDNQVHFHVIPRYGKTVFFDNQEFVDNKWPGPPSLESIEIDSVKIFKILELFKSCASNAK